MSGLPYLAAVSALRSGGGRVITRASPGNGSDAGSAHGRNARHRYPGFADYLSSEEKQALRELGRDPKRRTVPTPQALRLLSLGLAELSCGRLVLTTIGRRALAVVREPSRGSER